MDDRHAVEDQARYDAYRQSPEAEERNQVREAGARVYLLGMDQVLRFDAEAVANRLRQGDSLDRAVPHALYLTRDQFSNDIPHGLTSAVLARATDACRHIEDWVRGAVDDLAPSGPWPPPPAVDLHEAYAAREMLGTRA